MTNKIAIKQPDVDASNIGNRIESALKRHAEVEASAIRISVKDGNKVVKEGSTTGTNAGPSRTRRGRRQVSYPSRIA